MQYDHEIKIKYVYKIPIYLDGKYYNSINNYGGIILMGDIERITTDALDMLKKNVVEIKEIYVSTDRFKHLAVFAKSG